jgi:multidrug efflux pump subunit AcrA (membrane-fusion protein)
MDSSEPPRVEPLKASSPATEPAGVAAEGLPNGPEAAAPARRVPSQWASVRLLALMDLDSVWRSWLCRGFLLASVVVTVLALKSLQAQQKAASQMLEVLYATYLLIWMHGVIFIAGGAFSREQDCLNDAVLSRGITRGEYIGGKLLARCLAIFLLLGGVLLPCSFWAIRQDQLVRSETGYVRSHARNTKVEAWEPRKVFAGADGIITELAIELGVSTRAGDLVAQLDDRRLFDELERERRSEEDGRNEVGNARRRHDQAQRAMNQAEDALVRAERALVAKDLLSKLEQADRETELRARKRDLQNSENQVHTAEEAIRIAERAVENTQARVREARKRLGFATITAPVSGYVTELLVQRGQHVGLGMHLATLAPLDEYQVRVPIYDFDEYKRLRAGFTAYVTIGKTEFSGKIERLGATTQEDRWGRVSNFAVVRFKGDGTPGILGLNADVRLVLPPPPERPSRAAALLNTLTGRGVDDVASRTASVTPVWMLVAFGKVMGCAFMLVTLTLLLVALFRSILMAILGVAGLWHVSNLLFDFAGLPELSYLEMVRTMDKVLGGVAKLNDELAAVSWLFGLAVAFGVGTVILFIARDPPK